MKKFVLFLIGATILNACGPHPEPENAGPPSYQHYVNPQLIEQATSLFAALPDEMTSETNVLTFEKVRLGRKLYMDNRLSKEGNQSCNTCHNLQTYGVDNLPTSPGDNGGFGDRNSPTVYNAALHFVQFWDGRSPDVEDQAGGPILNPVEMAMPSKAYVVQRLRGIEEYRELFGDAFPGDGDPITYENLQLAIGAFERTLVTPSRFDDFLNGDHTALSDQEIRGLETFINTGCTTCHMGAALGGTTFQKFGVYDEYWKLTSSEHIDEGRYVVTESESDKYIFKVPSLRNIEKTGPYFHDGSVDDLEKATMIMARGQLNKELTEDELSDITAFLKSLTGEIPVL